MSRIGVRVTIGAGLIAGFVGLLLADVALVRWADFAYAPFFWAMLTAALVTGAWEFFRMMRAKDRPCQPAIGLVFIVVMVAMVFGETQFEPRLRPWLHTRGLEQYLLVIVALVFTTFIAEIVGVERNGTEPARAVAAVGWTVLVVLTVGLLGVFLAKIRFLPRTLRADVDPIEGFLYLVLAIGCVKGSDIGAYFTGTAIGRHKLVPRLSPGKTVEGLVGALVCGTAGAVAIGLAWGRFTLGQMLLFGAVVSVSSILGDLAESLIKRSCEVKDSGPIPTFGGALDILDSMLAAAPVAYLLLVLLSGPAAP